MFMSSYLELLNGTLKPDINSKYRVIDLFAGCGGLALGFEAAGFETLGYEMVQDFCDTYNRNLDGQCLTAKLDKDTTFPEADIVIGGPPCQPFSVGGHQLGLKDARDGFPAFISAVRKVKPKIWMFENVRGLMYKNKWYLEEITSSLEKLGYMIEIHLANAAHFGVPQNRERVIVIGHKGGYRFPERHSRIFTAGDAVSDIAFRKSAGWKYLTKGMDAYIAKYEKASKCITPRDLHMARPARTLTCRNLAGATGDMHRVRLANGKRRRITLREAARLQSFPDWFEFCGSENSAFTQIGNAVPPMLAYNIALSFADYLEAADSKKAKRGNIRSLAIA